MASTLIVSDLLIPGRGEPVENAALVLENGKISWIGGQNDIPPEYKHFQRIQVPVVLPGLWDAHVHFLGSRSYITEQLYREPRVLAGARVARDVAEVLNAGYTSVRELGGYGITVSKAIDEGYLIGPHIYAAGSVISMTGGHGDAHVVPLDQYSDACGHGLFFELCDGVDECIKAVRIQLRSGAKVIKICATGGVSSEIDHPKHQEFSDEELKAMVEEAHRAERIVAAHCHGTAGIRAALRAGVSTIEHGSFLDKETIEMMKKQDAILVATRTIVEGGLQLKNQWSANSYKKLQEVAEAARQSYKDAIKSGVRIALGTDIGFSMADTPFSHGRNAIELIYAVEAGLTPLQAIEAATAIGPETLGRQAPLSGQLKVGYDADVIAMASNPLEDIEVFRDANNVTHVWKSGQLVKGPGSQGIFLKTNGLKL